MATLHRLNVIRPSTFQLPPHLRTAAFTQAKSPSRHFTSTTRREIDPISIITAPPIYLMDSLHSLGLSWAAVIPCTAILLRGVLNHYLIALPQKRQSKQRAAIAPLIHAYQLTYRERPAEREKQRRMRERRAPPAEHTVYEVMVRLRGSLRAWWDLGYLTGVSRWNFWGPRIGSFALLITAMEAIRVKCGRGEGLVSLLFKPIAFIWDLLRLPGASARQEAAAAAQGQAGSFAAVASGDAATAASVSSSGEDGLREAIQPFEEQYGAEDTTGVSIDAADTSPSIITDLQPSMDTAMQTEGLPWCLDLTAADPTHILPFCLGLAIMVPAILSPQPLTPIKPLKQDYHSALEANLNTKEERLVIDRPAVPATFIGSRFPAFDEKMRSLTVMQRLTVIFASYFVLMSWSMPAGMVLYLISNWTIGFVQRVYLDVKFPSLRPITPCARPVRIRRRKIW